MAFERFITAGQAVSDILKSMTLSVPVSISGSTDPTTRLLWFLLGEEGQKILSEYQEWQMLTRVYTLTMTPGVTEYDLPADFQNFIDDTGWNMSARIPLLGPMTTQQWQLLQARQLGGTTLRLQYIIRGDKLVFYFAPTDSQTISIAYKGRGWVQDADDPLEFKDRPEEDNDIILFDPLLIKAALKNRWRIEKGFDTITSQQEYDNALESAKYDDRPKNTLSMGARSRYPYLGYWNMPDTGLGGS